MQPSLAFDSEDDRGTGRYTAVFFFAGAAVLGGVLLPFVQANWFGVLSAVGLIAVGIAAYAWLMWHSPKVKYYRSFWLDDEGVHWRIGPDHAARDVPWRLINSVEPVIAKSEYEANGVRVEFNEDGRYAESEIVPLTYRHQIEQATELIRDRISKRGV
jgi:hypothetical protein